MNKWICRGCGDITSSLTAPCTCVLGPPIKYGWPACGAIEMGACVVHCECGAVRQVNRPCGFDPAAIDNRG